MLKSKIKLFITAFFQVFFVSANTYFIANCFWIGIAIAGFSISFLWTINVKKIAISKIRERFIYSFGAMLGGLTGVFLSQIIIKI
jgi:hypothetical protein